MLDQKLPSGISGGASISNASLQTDVKESVHAEAFHKDSQIIAGKVIIPDGPFFTSVASVDINSYFENVHYFLGC